MAMGVVTAGADIPRVGWQRETPIPRFLQSQVAYRCDMLVPRSETDVFRWPAWMHWYVKTLTPQAVD